MVVAQQRGGEFARFTLFLLCYMLMSKSTKLLLVSPELYIYIDTRARARKRAGIKVFPKY